MVVIGSLSEGSGAGSQSYGGGIQPLIPTTSPILERKKKSTVKVEPTVQPKKQSPAKEKATGVLQGGKRFVARTAVGFGDLVTEAADFTVSFAIDNPIFNAPANLGEKVGKKIFGEEKAKKAKEKRNKWADFYKDKAEAPKRAVDRIQQTEYIRPSDNWEKASIKDKITKYPGETIALLGSNVAPSFALYALNPLVGLGTTIGATGNDVSEKAIQNGVSKEKASLLGAATGILVGALDRIVPDELFSGNQKSKFLGGFVKRIVPTSIKEATTEVAQENIQIISEETFREDLGWEEWKTRNALAGLGGLIGGAGATTVVGTVNNLMSQDIILEGESVEVQEEAQEQKVETPEETDNVVKLEKEPVLFVKNIQIP